MRKHIIYLASGSGRRFGCNKLLHPVEGKPMYLHGLLTLQKVVECRQDCRLLVVSRYEEIRKTAISLGIPAADCPESEKGISYTIRAGIEALGQVTQEDFLLFAVADQPWLSEESVEKLLEQAVPGRMGATLCWGDRPGNPNLFSARLIPELLALEGDRGGRVVLKKHQTILVQAQSAKELEDIDILTDTMPHL